MANLENKICYLTKTFEVNSMAVSEMKGFDVDLLEYCPKCFKTEIGYDPEVSLCDFCKLEAHILDSKKTKEIQQYILEATKSIEDYLRETRVAKTYFYTMLNQVKILEKFQKDIKTGKHIWGSMAVPNNPCQFDICDPITHHTLCTCCFCAYKWSSDGITIPTDPYQPYPHKKNCDCFFCDRSYRKKLEKVIELWEKESDDTFFDFFKKKYGYYPKIFADGCDIDSFKEIQCVSRKFMRQEGSFLQPDHICDYSCESSEQSDCDWMDSPDICPWNHPRPDCLCRRCLTFLQEFDCIDYSEQSYLPVGRYDIREQYKQLVEKQNDYTYFTDNQGKNHPNIDIRDKHNDSVVAESDNSDEFKEFQSELSKKIHGANHYSKKMFRKTEKRNANKKLKSQKKGKKPLQKKSQKNRSHSGKATTKINTKRLSNDDKTDKSSFTPIDSENGSIALLTNWDFKPSQCILCVKEKCTHRDCC